MKLAVLGIDLGKDSSSLVGLDQTGAVVFRRRRMRHARAADLARPQRKSRSSSATRPARHSVASQTTDGEASGRQRPCRGTIDGLHLNPRLPEVHT
jgi:hypothetical protein